MDFTVHASDGMARLGELRFERGAVRTPAFMPVGTYGTVKAMTPSEVRDTGADIILGNTFHLMLRPGTAVIEKHGGLHGFMQWTRPILTDSGGFQVWSLAERRKITEQGVTFASPVDGSRVFMGPEESMAVQRSLGSDIVMIFDECTPYPATEQQARASMELSLRWAERSKRAHEGNPSALFGIVQGGMYEELREQSLAGLQAIGSRTTPKPSFVPTTKVKNPSRSVRLLSSASPSVAPFCIFHVRYAAPTSVSFSVSISMPSRRNLRRSEL